MGLFSRNKKSSTNQLDWIEVNSIDELNQAIASTEEKPGLFFKHSTRCSISSMALRRFESKWEKTDNCTLYFINLIAHGDVSHALSEKANITHQSPQAILLQNEKAIYDASHNGISAGDVQQLI
jgi:bacillithiol system protein YtxJ